MAKIKSRYLFMILMSLTIFSLSITSCKEEEDEPEEEEESVVYPGVDERLYGYFLRFEAEAARRGFLIDLEELGITAEIRAINEVNVAGRCTFNSANPNHITIDLNFWQRSPDRFRELIVFHELGHCVLYRDHRDEVDNVGVCVSIMRSAEFGCEDNYIPTTRSPYIDELFDTRFIDELRDD